MAISKHAIEAYSVRRMMEQPWCKTFNDADPPASRQRRTSLRSAALGSWHDDSSLQRAKRIVTEGFRVPEGEVYQVVESPRGELGYYVVSDGTAQRYRMHMRTPSFGSLQATSSGSLQDIGEFRAKPFLLNGLRAVSGMT
jgi:NADH:ubiquinone oxidoreductase subunit D